MRGTFKNLLKPQTWRKIDQENSEEIVPTFLNNSSLKNVRSAQRSVTHWKFQLKQLACLWNIT